MQNKTDNEKIEEKQPEKKHKRKWQLRSDYRILILTLGLSLFFEAFLIYSSYSADVAELANTAQEAVFPVFSFSFVTICGLLLVLTGLFASMSEESSLEKSPSDEELEKLERLFAEQEDQEDVSDLELLDGVEDTEESPKPEKAPEQKTEAPKKTQDDEAALAKKETEKAPEHEEKLSWTQRLARGLSKTRTGFVSKLKKLLLGSPKIDEELLEDIEETLYSADIGVQTVQEIVNHLKEKTENGELKTSQDIVAAMKERLGEMLDEFEAAPVLNPDGLSVYLIVGINGVGKTTTVAKLASYFKSEGKKVMLAAGDTFRAAAIDQLLIWGERVGVEVISGSEGGDPGALVFDAIHAAQKRNADVLLIDTAGRMHVKANLMAELKKVHKIASKEAEGAPHEILLVLDAVTGQNAVQQAEQFSEILPLTGLVVTKLDGTAKGGIIFAVSGKVKVPVKFIGVGEKMEDLRPFKSKEFLEALFADTEGKTKQSDYKVL